MVLMFTDGTWYEGEWKDDKMEGQGILTYTDGTFYKGEWKDNDMNGYGILTYIGIDPMSVSFIIFPFSFIESSICKC